MDYMLNSQKYFYVTYAMHYILLFPENISM